VTDTKVAEGASRVPKARVAKQTGSVAKTRAAGDAHRVNEARGVGARSGAAAKAAEDRPRATDTEVIKGACAVARAKAAKETGSVVKFKAAEEARGRSKGH
jgi:hypothetical protein